MNVYNVIADKFASGEWIGYGKKRIFAELGTKSTFERRAIEDVLRRLEKDCVVVYADGKFLRPEDCSFIKGVIRGNERGFAFVPPELFYSH